MARGGSKSIPGKNIKDLCGKPLMLWAIDAARSCPLIDRVILSTDDDEIAAVARAHRVELPFTRPSHLAQDHTPDFPVLEHAIDWLEENESYIPDIVVHLRPTGPMVTEDELTQAIELLEEHPSADSVRSVQESSKPPFKMWKLQGTFMEPFATVPGMKDSHTQPRQFLPKTYETTPDIGVFRTITLREKKSIIGDTVLPFILSRQTADIDSPIDFELARILLEERLQKIREKL